MTLTKYKCGHIGAIVHNNLGTRKGNGAKGFIRWGEVRNNPVELDHEVESKRKTCPDCAN